MTLTHNVTKQDNLYLVFRHLEVKAIQYCNLRSFSLQKTSQQVLLDFLLFRININNTDRNFVDNFLQVVIYLALVANI